MSVEYHVNTWMDIGSFVLVFQTAINKQFPMKNSDEKFTHDEASD